MEGRSLSACDGRSLTRTQGARIAALFGRPRTPLSGRAACADGSACFSPNPPRCPQRDSNPCYGLERAATWTASRWGPGRPSGYRASRRRRHFEAHPAHVTSEPALPQASQPRRAGRQRPHTAVPQARAQTSAGRSTTDAGARSRLERRSSSRPGSPALPAARCTHRAPPNGHRLFPQSSCEEPCGVRQACASHDSISSKVMSFLSSICLCAALIRAYP